MTFKLYFQDINISSKITAGYEIKAIREIDFIIFDCIPRLSSNK